MDAGIAFMGADLAAGTADGDARAWDGGVDLPCWQRDGHLRNGLGSLDLLGHFGSN